MGIDLEDEFDVDNIVDDWVCTSIVETMYLYCEHKSMYDTIYFTLPVAKVYLTIL